MSRPRPDSAAPPRGHIIRRLIPSLLLVCAGTAPAQDTISLHGSWRFELNPGPAITGWTGRQPNFIDIPGTTDLAGYGPKAPRSDEGRLVRQHAHVGPAWYQRAVDIPETWRGKQVELFLERVLWTSRAWIDAEPAGDLQNSLTTPHRHRLGSLEPGHHVLTVCIDNSRHVEIGVMGHSYTEETQSIWNGMVGRVELVARDPVSIDALRAFPDAARSTVRVEVTVANHSGQPVRGRLVAGLSREARWLGQATHTLTAAPGTTIHELSVAMAPSVAAWDEFQPALYHLEVGLQSADGRDVAATAFGFRTFERVGRRILVNGRPTFLRGTVECCVFPATGHPPADVDSWTRIFTIARSWGMNHFRFHSWCPPDAAFTAADQLGIYLQPETPTWVEAWMRERTPAQPADFGRDPAVNTFVRAELRRITDTYGNHPSFCMLSIGNELGAADWELAAGIIEDARSHDPRRLYAVCTARKLTNADDYYVTHATPGGTARGLGRPSTDWDFAPAVDSVAVPLIAHETGQRPVYPDYSKLQRHYGPLQPDNLQVFRRQFGDRGMMKQNLAFVRASGAWTLRQYRHEIEAILRTPGYAGFQLLQLNDFTGQSEALVGLLDPFWNEKGAATTEQFRSFCSPTVPLVELEKFVWEGGERFSANVLVAHFGSMDLAAVTPRWTLWSVEGEDPVEGSLDTRDVPTGTRTRLGSFECELPDLGQPAKLTLELQVGAARNAWDLWLFPRAAKLEEHTGIVVATKFDAATKAALADGGSVLMLPEGVRNPRVFRGGLFSVYWSAAMFKQPQGTLGILCDPQHPALRYFPNDGHTDWQWRTLIEDSDVFVLDDAPREYLPIVQPISDFHYNHKLGSVFEARVGPGRLLVCGLRLGDDPAARGMRQSLVAYAGSDEFTPQHELPIAFLEELFADVSAAIEVDGAALNVSCAGTSTVAERNVPWRPELDRILAAQPGYRAELDSEGTWLDAQGNAWFGNPLTFVVYLPKKTTGTLRLRFHDWNGLGRRGKVAVDGRSLELGAHSETAQWLEWPIDAEATADGRLQVSAKPSAGPNLMVTQIAFVPTPR